MRAVLLEVPEAMLNERHRLGLDGRDEVWNGVLHMVPPAGGPPQRLGSELLQVLAPLSKRRGLVASYETGLFRTADDYQVPDQLYCRPEHESERGAEGGMRSEVLGVQFATVEGRLRITWRDGVADV